MIEQIFGSKTRVKLLGLFFVNPKQSFYIREITRRIDEQINSVRRELANLKKAGIVSGKKQGQRTYFSLNPKFEFFSEFKKIFTKIGKKYSTENKLAQKIKKTGQVVFACLCGRFTQTPNTEVDLLIVGKVDKRKIKTLTRELERESGFEVHYAVLTLEDFNYRKSLYDRFLMNVLDAPKIVLINELGLGEEV